MHTTLFALPGRPRTRAVPASRPVAAVIEDGPAGPAVTRAAITLARYQAATEIVLVVPVEAGAGFTSDPAVLAARRRRLHSDAEATAARVLPSLEPLDLRWSVQPVEVRPSARGRRRAVDATLRSAARRHASAIVCPEVASPTVGLDADSLERRQWSRPGATAIPVVGVPTRPAAPRAELTPGGRTRLEERAERLRELGGHTALDRDDASRRLDFGRPARQLAEHEALLAEAIDVVPADAGRRPSGWAARCWSRPPTGS